MFIILLLLFFNLSKTSRDDGRIMLNEKFQQVLYQHPAYKVYLFTFGLEFKQILKLNDENLIFLTKNKHCPLIGNIYTCDEKRISNLLLQFSLKDYQIMKKVELPRLIAKQDDFRPKIIGDNIQTLLYIDPYLSISELINVNIKNGNITNVFPRDSEYFLGYSGTTSIRSQRTYIVNLYNGAIDVFNQDLIREYSIKLYDQNITFVNMDVDPIRSFMYVLGYETDDKTILLRFRRPIGNQTFVERVVIPEEKDHQAEKVFVTPSGDIFIGFVNKTVNILDYSVFDNYILKKVSLDLRVTQTLQFFMKICVGAFFDQKNDIMYLFGNSELVKIKQISQESFFNGTMNIRAGRVRYITYGMNNNIPIDSAALFDENTAYLGSKIAGFLFKVDLTKFLDEKLDYPNDSNYIVQSFALFGTTVLVTFFIVFTIFFIICCLYCRTKRKYEELE